MPDPPPPRRQYSPAGNGHKTVAVLQGQLRYAELHCRTNFSFLEGASHPDELVERAAGLGYEALAVTDRNSLAGVVRAHVAAKDLGLKLIVGAEITPVDAPPVVLLATDRASYGRLSRLITRGRRNAPKGECRLTFDDVAEHAEGLLGLVVSAEVGGRSAERETSFSRAPQGSALPIRSALRPPTSALSQYREVFADRCYALAELHHGPHDGMLLSRMIRLSEESGVPLVAANDVHCHVSRRQVLQDVLTAIREGCSVAELGSRRFPNGERHLKSAAEMARLFSEYPQAVARTVEVADRCRFSLDELRYDYPEELCPAGETPLSYFTRLTWEGAGRRYPHGIPEKVRGLIEHELQLIAELRYEAYFLTVWDLVRYARSRGILCQGRGSAANSAVCYCLGVTSVDPERIDVLFERFVSKERDEAPDIDVDFEHERREEVLQYIYEKYGRDRAGMTAVVITYRPRSAIRDVGKALGLSLDRIDALAQGMEHFREEDKLARRFREAGLNPTSRLGRQYISLVREIQGFPRHLSQHVGGMVMTEGLLSELTPIENAAMPGRTVIQWDKNDLDALGILKVDCLSLGMLTAIHKCFDLLRDHYGRPLSLADVPAEDAGVYEMIQRADTTGVFQIESRAQMSMLPRLKPKCFYDLVIEVAIVRPGPIQGDMVHPYLRRRNGEEPVDYPDERIRAVLEKTLGVPIFQEQAMRLAVVAAGFTPGEADQLRRAMGAWRRPGIIDRFRQKLIEGMRANGYPDEFAERLFKQIRGFGEYGFPESHAASFALLVYVSAWLKRYYPDVFAAALLNSQPMGFYAPAQLVANARQHGVDVLPVDVNVSGWDCSLEARSAEVGARSAETALDGSSRSAPGASGSLPAAAFRDSQGRTSRPCHHPTSALALRLGLRMLRGLAQSPAERIVECRTDRPFVSFDDFVKRTGLSNAVLAKLSRADAFGSLELNRRTALWESLPDCKQLPLFDGMNSADGGSAGASPSQPSHTSRSDLRPPTSALPPMSPLAEVVADYRSAGLSLRDHPLKFIRPQLDELHVVQAAELAVLPAGRRLKVAGLVLLRQRPGTASGITFVTLEDETGMANLIVRPEIWERDHQAARTARVMLAQGVLQRQHGVIHVLVDRLEDLSAQMTDGNFRSRDFR